MIVRTGSISHHGTPVSEKIRLSRFLLRLLLLTVLASSFGALAQPVSGAEKQDSGMPKVLRVGFSSNIFTDVDTRDAQVAMELWARELARGAGITQASVTILHTPEELSTAVRKGSLDIVTIPALEFIRLRDTLQLLPAFVASNHVGRAREQILIVSRKSGIRKFADLRGKTIDLLPEKRYEPAHIWLEILLAKEGKGSLSAYFHKLNKTPNASQAIMRVFFGKVDATIIHRGSFETAKTLNPQLGQQLLVIAESKSIIGDVSCIPASISMKLRHAMENAAAHLHENAMGRQMIALFQIDRVIPYQAFYLDGLTALLDEQANMKAKPAKRR
jgi:ABC-type phosphate/phosphonate transport system substrate-binding protein